MAQNEKYRLVIERDPDPGNPRGIHDTLGTMVYWHPRYKLGDEEIERPTSDDDKPDALVVLPLYLYDHSGLTMSTKPFSCAFDSGQVGWIYMTADNIRELLGLEIGQPITLDDDKRKRVVECLEAEVTEYDAYLRGDVWGFNAYKLDTCEHCKHTDAVAEDSCWGFVNIADDDAKEAIRDHLISDVKGLVDEAWENRV